MSKLYVCTNEFAGDKVGTLEEIDEWLGSEGVSTSDSEFFELGKAIKVKLVVVEKK